MTENTHNIDIESGIKLPVMEEFYSLQGEGYNTGEAAYFVRIGGCDVGCHFCDVKEAWNAALFSPVDVREVIERIRGEAAKAVVVTGGEPLLYNLNYFCSLLKQSNIKTFLETSGTERFSGDWDWICISPKRNAETLPVFYEKANELKVIIESTEDFERAERYAGKVSENCRLYLQPEWSVAKTMTQPIVEYILRNPQWKLSLQTHKFINIP